MNKSILNSGLLFLCIVLSVACRAKKKIVVAPPAKIAEKDSTIYKREENINQLKSKNINFNTLSLKAKVNLDIDGWSNKAMMNIKIERDKRIWVNVTALGIAEVTRLLITPDSIFLLNRQQNTALKKPFSYIHNFVSKKVDFRMLQSVLTGNTIDDFLTPDVDLKKELGIWTLKGATADLAYGIIFDTLLKPNTVSLNDVKAAQALKIEYRNYATVNTILFPSVIFINTAFSNQKINMELNFVKIEQDVPLEFPFTIPKRFKIIN